MCYNYLLIDSSFYSHLSFSGECTFYKKRFKEHQTIIQYHLKNNAGTCSGYECMDSKIKYIESFKCKELSKEENNPFGCIIGLHYYRPQETIAVSYDKNGCELTQVCNEDGSTVKLIEKGCLQATPTSTEPPVKCFYNGKYYSPGNVVEKGKTATFCYTILCGWNGKVIHGDDFKCSTFNTPTTPPNNTPTIHAGKCYYNGGLYNLGTVIEEGQTGTWCYKTFCDENGKILHMDNFNCKISTNPYTLESTTKTS